MPYTSRPTPYRFLRLQSAAGVVQLDAIQAASLRPDSDGDGLPDGWELRYGLDPRDASGRNGAGGDPDGDGRNNAQEYAADTNPTRAGSRLFVPIASR